MTNKDKAQATDEYNHFPYVYGDMYNNGMHISVELDGVVLKWFDRINLSNKIDAPVVWHYDEGGSIRRDVATDSVNLDISNLGQSSTVRFKFWDRNEATI